MSEVKILIAIFAIIILITAIWIMKIIYDDWKYYEHERQERKVIIRESERRIKDGKKKNNRKPFRGIKNSNKKRV